MKKGIITVILENKTTATLVFINPQNDQIPIANLNKKEVFDLQKELNNLFKNMI